MFLVLSSSSLLIYNSLPRYFHSTKIWIPSICKYLSMHGTYRWAWVFALIPCLRETKHAPWCYKGPLANETTGGGDYWTMNSSGNNCRWRGWSRETISGPIWVRRPASGYQNKTGRLTTWVLVVRNSNQEYVEVYKSRPVGSGWKVVTSFIL